jgi:hypothetical protein
MPAKVMVDETPEFNFKEALETACTMMEITCRRDTDDVYYYLGLLAKDDGFGSTIVTLDPEMIANVQKKLKEFAKRHGFSFGSFGMHAICFCQRY